MTDRQVITLQAQADSRRYLGSFEDLRTSMRQLAAILESCADDDERRAGLGATDLDQWYATRAEKGRQDAQLIRDRL